MIFNNDSMGRENELTEMLKSKQYRKDIGEYAQVYGSEISDENNEKFFREYKQVFKTIHEQNNNGDLTSPHIIFRTTEHCSEFDVGDRKVNFNANMDIFFAYEYQGYGGDIDVSIQTVGYEPFGDHKESRPVMTRIEDKKHNRIVIIDYDNKTITTQLGKEDGRYDEVTTRYGSLLQRDEDIKDSDYSKKIYEAIENGSYQPVFDDFLPIDSNNLPVEMLLEGKHPYSKEGCYQETTIGLYNLENQIGYIAPKEFPKGARYIFSKQIDQSQEISYTSPIGNYSVEGGYEVNGKKFIIDNRRIGALYDPSIESQKLVETRSKSKMEKALDTLKSFIKHPIKTIRDAFNRDDE